MEEARLDLLEKLGYPMTRLESEGITSPVVSVNCDYKRPSTFGDEIEIEVSVAQYTGVKLTLSYIMKNIRTGETVAVASSVHCFTDANRHPIAVKKHFPEFDSVLRNSLTNIS